MINLIIACALCGALSLVVGSIWYNPKTFGTIWMQEIGLTEEDAQKGNMPMIFGLSFLICCYLAYEMKWVNHPDEKLNFFLHGMFHGVRHVGVFAVGAIVVNALFEQRSFKLIFINAAYWLVLMGLMGGVLASFPPFEEKKETTTEEKTTDSTTVTGMIDQQDVINSLQKENYYYLR